MFNGLQKGLKRERKRKSLFHPSSTFPIYLKVLLPNTFATSDLLTSINSQYPDALFELFYLNIAKGTTDPGVDCFDQ